MSFMKLSIFIATLFFSTIAYAQFSSTLQVQQTGTSRGQFTGINFASGCTVDPKTSTVAQINCTGSGGTVTSVTASSPLQSSGGNTPNISLTGQVAIANGGTSAATTSQNFAFIGPTSGAGAPSFRALAAGDIPSLSGTYLPLAGGTMTGNLLFTDNSLDIGASGATRPRTGYFGTSLITPTLAAPTSTGLVISSPINNGTTPAITFNTTGTTFQNNYAYAFQTNGADMMKLFAQSSGTTMNFYTNAGTLVSGLTFQNNVVLGNGSNAILGNSSSPWPQIWARAYVTMTQNISQSTATATLDASSGGVMVITLTANVTSWNITNCVAGQFVSITWVQGAGQPWTLAGANSNIKFLPQTYLVGGTFSTPTLSTGAAARDYEDFVCRSSTEIVEIGRSFGH